MATLLYFLSRLYSCAPYLISSTVSCFSIVNLVKPIVKINMTSTYAIWTQSLRQKLQVYEVTSPNKYAQETVVEIRNFSPIQNVLHFLDIKIDVISLSTNAQLMCHIKYMF